MRGVARVLGTVFVGLSALLAGCAGGPPAPAVIETAVEVKNNVNPDARGRASPVVVKLYELKSRALFDTADFFSLFERDRETLAAELTAREEYQLMPGDKRKFSRTLQGETRFVGVVAAFRDLERAQWRAIVAVPPSKTTPVAITLDGKKISISAR